VGGGDWQTLPTQLPLQQSLGAPHERPASVHGLCASHVPELGLQIELQHSIQLVHVAPFAEHDASPLDPASKPPSEADGASMLAASTTSAASSITNAASTFASTGLPASSRGGA
jgi:hypothetical protein